MHTFLCVPCTRLEQMDGPQSFHGNFLRICSLHKGVKEMISTEGIVCPECGGTLEYWKEYIVTKTQKISKEGLLNHSVKISKLEPFNCNDMQGLQCKACGWTFNCVNEIEKYDKYEHLLNWINAHEDEIKV